MFYGFVRFWVRLCFRLYFRWEVYGSHHLPPKGGVILASNHVSYLDPPLMGCAVNRPVHFMGKKELFDIPLFGRIFRKLYAFPVERNGADRQAIRQALTVINQGGVLGIFPEGTRGDGTALLKPQLGTVLLASKSGAPIVPMAIVGAEKAVPPGKCIPRPGKIKIYIGAPIYLPDIPRDSYRESMGEYSQELMNRIDELRSQGMIAA
ncbi:MAG: 1-acyl-sn-glycerol-3-phosphate acyltransferase [Firmicutes bacterium]|nr:1-acyl-sn-glycerol-3-phosphate acyltransferase [Bacillota bacterium]